MNDTCEYCGAVLQDQELPLNLPPGRDRFCGIACKVAFDQELPEPSAPILSDEPYLWDLASFCHP